MKRFEKKTLDKEEVKKTADVASIVKKAGAIVTGVVTVAVGIGKIIIDSQKKS